jgi:hypothetical protein
MLKSFLLALFLAVTISCIGGCEAKPISGEVVTKRFEPAHDEWQGTGIEDIPFVLVKVPDRWFITIVGPLPNGTKSKPLSISVPKSEYDDYKVGDWYTPPKRK